MNTKTKTSGKGRIAKSNAGTALDMSDLPIVSVTTDCDALRARIFGAIDANISALQLDPKGAHCATQWERLRATVSPQFAGNVIALRDAGTLTQGAIDGAVLTLRDGGKSAPIYGAQKMLDTLAMLASKNRGHVSKLHAAYLTVIVERSQVDNAGMCRAIEDRATCAPSTSSTQRSSSAYALRALGIISETREGATLIDSAATDVLRDVFSL